MEKTEGNSSKILKPSIEKKWNIGEANSDRQLTPPNACDKFLSVRIALSGSNRNWKDGGADRDRTGDPNVANVVLSQLSYSPPF